MKIKEKQELLRLLNIFFEENSQPKTNFWNANRAARLIKSYIKNQKHWKEKPRGTTRHFF